MDISLRIAELKKLPGFNDHVGMILIHNGVVRSWSREGQGAVQQVQVRPDQEMLARIQEESSRLPGIFKVIIEAREGTFEPGDDLLFIIVAGDLRENVKQALSQTLDAVKSKAIQKQEILAD